MRVAHLSKPFRLLLLLLLLRWVIGYLIYQCPCGYEQFTSQGSRGALCFYWLKFPNSLSSFQFHFLHPIHP